MTTAGSTELTQLRFWRQGGVVNICNHQVFFPFQLSELVERVLNEDKLCITLGGDHAIGIGTIQVLLLINGNEMQSLKYLMYKISL